MNSLSSPAKSPQLPLDDPATERVAAKLAGREEDIILLVQEMYREGRQRICLGRKVTRLLCLLGRGSPRLAQRMLFRNNSFLFWTFCFFLGTSSGTCSSSLSRFTTTSGHRDQPSLVTVHKYLISGSSARSDDPRATAKDAKGVG